MTGPFLRPSSFSRAGSKLPTTAISGPAMRASVGDRSVVRIVLLARWCRQERSRIDRRASVSTGVALPLRAPRPGLEDQWRSVGTGPAVQDGFVGGQRVLGVRSARDVHQDIQGIAAPAA